MHTRTMKYEFKAGGYPTPTYRGQGEVSITTDEDDGRTAIGERDELLRRAKNKVSSDLVMDKLMVEITNHSIS